MKCSFVPQTFFRFFFRIRIEDFTMKFIEKAIFYILKTSSKLGVDPQSFCENQNSVQDQDQDHDLTLDFNTRLTFHTEKTPTKLCLDPNSFESYCGHIKSPRTYRQTDTQRDIQTEFFLLALFSK